jgi:hypothetical protein
MTGRSGVSALTRAGGATSPEGRGKNVSFSLREKVARSAG